MRNHEASFEFHGHQVLIEVTPVGKDWGWNYSIDGRRPVSILGHPLHTEHAAFEEAGMAARDRIRTMRNPSWRSESGFGQLYPTTSHAVFAAHGADQAHA